MKRFSIQFKLLFVITGLLVLAIVISVVISVVTQRRNLNRSVEDALLTNTKLLDLVLRNTMLAGEVSTMVNNLESFQEIEDFEEIKIFRSDGSVAFSEIEGSEAERQAILNNENFKKVLETEKPVSVQLTKNSEMEYFFPIMKTADCSVCHPGEETIRGIEYFRISFRESVSRINRATWILIGSLFVVALICGAVLIPFARRIIVKPLVLIQEIITNLKNGDLTKKIEFKSNDELGDLARVFGEFIDSFNDIVKQLKSVIGKTRRMSADLAESSAQSTAAMEEIRVNVEGIKDKTVTLDAEVVRSNQSASGVKDFISNVVDLINDQAAAINESSSSIEQMSASIQNIAKVAEEKLKIASELESGAHAGENEMDETTELIKMVAESANATMEMTNVIDGIASQTNLLAVNAAIEAAHAVEYGKGFAVVADEVRNLAESSGESAKDIKRTLTEVADYISRSEQSTGRSGKIFTDIVRGITKVSESMAELQNATRELASGSSQILGSLKILLELTGEVKASSSGMDSEIEKITASMERLTLVSADAKTGMEEISVGIREVYTSAEQVSKTGIENSEGATLLEELIDRFKVDQD